MEAQFISTGARSLDGLLGGGIRAGMLTDVFGESGSGKSQLCFSLCVNCAKAGMNSFFIDTAGTFRPERISEMANSAGILDKINVVRPLRSQDQESILERVYDLDSGLIIVDTLTSLFSAEYSGPARHLAVMSYLRKLAVLAINAGCIVVVTNMIRNVPMEGGKSIQREYLGNSVSMYSHVRLKLSSEVPSKGWFRAEMIQPQSGSAQFAITSRGIADRD